MLKFICDTGGEEFEATIEPGGKVTYMKDNLRVHIVSEGQDCTDCALEIQQEASKITEEARQRVRAKKQQQ